MAKASYGFRSRIQARALCLAGFVAVLEGCTDPTFVPRDAAGSSHEEPEEAGHVERDASVARDAEPGVLDTGLEQGTDAQVRADAASEDAGSAMNDAGETMLAGNDAGAGGALPSWALGLVGTYAKRSVNFSYDDDLIPPDNTLNVEHSLVKIAQNNDELRVTVQPCSYTVALRTSPDLPVIFKHPDRFPPLTGTISLGENNTFSSGQMVSHLGFDPARGKDCTGGRHAVYEDQAWITGGSCQCFAGVLPAMQTDCRVTDTDGDNRSGITMLNPGAISGRYADVSIVFDYAVTFTAGELKTGKRVELSESRAQTQACINASNDGCSVGKNQLCPNVGSTKLLRLSEQVTDAGCDAIDKGAFGPVDTWPADVDCRAK